MADQQGALGEVEQAGDGVERRAAVEGQPRVGEAVDRSDSPTGMVAGPVSRSVRRPRPASGRGRRSGRSRRAPRPVRSSPGRRRRPDRARRRPAASSSSPAVNVSRRNRSTSRRPRRSPPLTDAIQQIVSEPPRRALPDAQGVVGGTGVEQQAQVAERLDDLGATEEGDAGGRHVRHLAAGEGACNLLAVPVDGRQHPDRRERRRAAGREVGHAVGDPGGLVRNGVGDVDADRLAGLAVVGRRKLRRPVGERAAKASAAWIRARVARWLWAS